MEESTSIEVTKKKGFWSSINWARVATGFTIIGLLAGWIISGVSAAKEKAKEHDQTIIFQHDQDQRLDSVVNLQAQGQVRFETLRKSREESLEKTAIHEKEQDAIIVELRIRNAVLEKEIELLINKKIK